MFNAVLFDMDGVLIDSQPMHFIGDQKTLEAIGIKAPIEEMIKYAGTTNQLRFSMFKEKYGFSQAEEDMIRYREELMIKIVRDSDAVCVRGIPKLLELLKSKNIKMAVASSSSYPFIYAVLDKLGIRAYFDLVFSGENVPNGKPAPDVFLETARILGCTADECLVIEDSHNGVLAANRAGMRCIGYQNPTSGEQDLTTAELVIDDFNLLTEDILLKVME